MQMPIINVTVDSGTNWSAWAAVLLSGVLAVITLVYALDNRRMARILRAQYDNERLANRRSQAEQVSGWASDGAARTRLVKEIIIEVVNNSYEPIFDLSVTVCDINGEPVPSAGFARAVVAPGERIRSDPKSIDIRVRAFPQTGAMVEMDFLDARHVAWHRGPQEDLRENNPA